MTATFFSQLQERIPNEVMTTLIDGVLGVETELRAQVQSDIRMVQDIGEHTLEAGGKRLRPALVSLAILLASWLVTYYWRRPCASWP